MVTAAHLSSAAALQQYTCGSVLRKYAFKKVRPLDGILRVKKVRVLARSIYFLNLTQPQLAPKLDGVMCCWWRGMGEETSAETGRTTLSRKHFVVVCRFLRK